MCPFAGGRFSLSLHPTCWLIVSDSAQLHNDSTARDDILRKRASFQPTQVLLQTHKDGPGRFDKMFRSLPHLFSPWREQLIPAHDYRATTETQKKYPRLSPRQLLKCCLLSLAWLQEARTGSSVGLPGSGCKWSHMKPGLCQCLKLPEEVRSPCVI